MSEFYVYIWRNNLTHRLYVGKGRGRRAWSHLKPNARGLLARSIRRHGIDAFELTLVAEGLSEDFAFDLERTLIGAYRTQAPHGYNITLGGGGAAGFKHSEEALQKMSAVHKGKKLAPWHTERIKAANRGRKCSPTEIASRVARLRGVPKSEEHREKIRTALTGRKLPPERVASMSAVAKGRVHSADTVEKCRKAKATPEICARWARMEELYAQGLNFNQIAKALDVGWETVAKHLRRKLGVQK